MNNSYDQILYFLSSSKTEDPLNINIVTFEQPLLKLTLVNILEAINNFYKTNITGNGGFGTVYIACLPNGRTDKVKKLSQAKAQGEVEHRSLVSLLGYCSYDEVKILVYEYMANESLDHWLRIRTGTIPLLYWSKRFKIALGSARDMVNLHHGFIPHIIPREIKASNIFLEEEFEHKVANFGLEKLISACKTQVSTSFAGTLGYTLLEYGQSWKLTTRGDVYNFGVILLELLSGKEPTGPDFKDIEGGNLVGCVFLNIKNGRAVNVLEPAILVAESKKMMLKALQTAKLRGSHHLEDKVNFEGEGNDAPVNLKGNTTPQATQQPKRKEAEVPTQLEDISNSSPIQQPSRPICNRKSVCHAERLCSTLRVRAPAIQ